MVPALGFSLDLSPRSSLHQGIRSPSVDIGSALSISNDDMLPTYMGEVTDVEKALMLQAARSAMDELVKLLRIDEPLWIKFAADGQFVLHRDSYEKIYPKANHFKTSTTRVEASKDSRIVCMNGIQLVDMFLDSVSA